MARPKSEGKLRKKEAQKRLKKVTPLDLVAVPKQRGKKREAPKTFKQVKRQAAGPKAVTRPKLVKPKTPKGYARKGRRPTGKNGGEPILDALDAVYKAGDKVAKSGAGKFLLGNDPAGKFNKREGAKRRAEIKGRTKKVTKPVIKNLQIANKKIEKSPVGIPVKAARFPLEQLAKPAVAGAKALWYSDEVIKAAAAGKSPKKIVKASQGKEKTSGRALAKSIGIDPKKHKGANILAGGAIDLTAQAPLAAASGGTGTVAQSAGRAAAKQTLKAEVKAETKKAGVRKMGQLPKKTQKETEERAERARENAQAQASAKYGRRRELRAGVDVRVPFGRGRRIQKTVPVTRPITKTRVKLAERADKIEAKGGRLAKPVGKTRNAANRVNLGINTRAKPRELPEHEALAIEDAGRKKRAADAVIERDANNLYQSLVADIKKGEDPRPAMVKIESEIEKLGPNSTSPVARQLHELQKQAHDEMVKRGLAPEWGGRKLTEWDYRGLGNKSKKGRAKLNADAKVARQQVHTAKKQAKLTAKNPGVGAKATEGTKVEAMAGARQRRSQDYTKAKERHEAALLTANEKINRVNRQLAVLAEKPRTPGNLQKIKDLKAERLAHAETARKHRSMVKIAEKGAKREGRLAEQTRRVVGTGDVKRAQEAAKKKSVNLKKHDELVKELKAAPATKNIEETTDTLERFAQRFEQIGDKATARHLRKKIEAKKAEPEFHTPRPRLKPDPAIQKPPNARKALTKPKSRILRTQTVEEAAKTGKVDLSPEAIVKEIRDRRSSANASDYWKGVATKISDQGDGNPFYAITPAGISDEFATAEEAFRKVNEIGAGRVVRLNEKTRNFLERKGQLHHADFTGNTISRGGRATVGAWKRVAILTPTNYMRNLVGDTTRSVALGGSGALHSKDAFKIVRAETKRQAVERNVARFAEDANISGHRLTDPQLQKIMDQTITIGHGKQKRDVTVGEMIDEMTEQGIMESGMIRSDVLTGGKKDAAVHKPGPLAGVDRKVSAREMLSRSHLYMNARSAGLSADESAEVVRKALIDYGDVSEFEEAMRRTFIPFIVFKGRNIATWSGHIVRKPGKLKQYQTVFDTSAQLAGFDNYAEFQKEAGKAAQNLPLPLPKSLQPFGVNVVNPSFPIGDLFNTYKQVSDVHDIGTAVGQQLFAGRLLLDVLPRVIKGVPSNEPSKQLPVDRRVGEFLMKHPRLVRTFRLSKGLNFDGKVAYFGHPAVMDALGMTPESGALGRAGSAQGGPWYLPILNFFSGAGGMSIKPGTGELQKIRADLKDIEVQLNNPLPSEAARKNLYKKREKLKKKRNEKYAAQGVKWAQEATGKKPAASSGGQKLPAGWK